MGVRIALLAQLVAGADEAIGRKPVWLSDSDFVSAADHSYRVRLADRVHLAENQSPPWSRFELSRGGAA